MRKLLIGILALMLVMGDALAGAESSRVGMECNYAPFNWTQTEPGEYAVPIKDGGGYAPQTIK